MIQNFALLALGIIVLIWSGDLLVRGAAALARHWGVPALIVGLTIVAFGTSAPELVVAVQAVMDGSSELAAGNVVGSNIANILLVLGLPAVIMAIPTNIAGVGRNAVICLGATSLFIILCLIQNPLHVWQGAILFAGILIYLAWMLHLARAGAEDPILAEMTEIDEGKDGLPTNVLLSGLFIIIGLIGLVIGGNMIVGNSVKVAEAFNVSETIIGLTIVAIGTSLPELATVVVAAYRGQTDVALGNVLGSNVFNLFAVMGAAALAGPVVIERDMYIFDIWVMLAAAITILVLILSRRPISRGMGLLFSAAYILYILALISRAI